MIRPPLDEFLTGEVDDFVRSELLAAIEQLDVGQRYFTYNAFNVLLDGEACTATVEDSLTLTVRPRSDWTSSGRYSLERTRLDATPAARTCEPAPGLARCGPRSRGTSRGAPSGTRLHLRRSPLQHPWTYATKERGPPANYNDATIDDADGFCSLGASARPNAAATLATYDYDDLASFVQTSRGSSPGARRHVGSAEADLTAVERSRVAAKTATRADIASARFAQKSYSEMFTSGGRFAGRSIDDVAGSLRSGALSPKDVPIDVIVRDGNSLILNARSSQALIRAGVPRSSWTVIDRTGQAALESRLTNQLTRNGLSSHATELP